jgi:hypothetical protein
MELHGSATTYYRYWEEVDLGSGTDLVRAPLQQYLSFTLTGLGIEGLSVSASALGWSELEDVRAGEEESDLLLYTGYLEGRDLGGWFDFRLGRQLLVAGLRPITLDGVWAAVGPWSGVTLEVYGGVWRDQRSFAEREDRDGACGAMVRCRAARWLWGDFGYHFRDDESGELKLGTLALGSALPGVGELGVQLDYDFTAGDLREWRGEATFGSGPWRVGISGSRYDPALDTDWEAAESPFRIFSGGREDELAGTLSMELMPNLEAYGRGGPVRYDRLSGEEQTGREWRLGVRSVTWRRPWLAYDLSWYVLDLDGLDASGLRATVDAALLDWLSLGAGLESADYTKVGLSGDEVSDDARTWNLSLDVKPLSFLELGVLLERSVNVEYEENTRTSVRIRGTW